MARRSYTVAQVDIGFDINGEAFQPAYLSLLDIGELARFADMSVDDADGLAKVTEFFQLILGEDYDRFKELVGRLHMRPAQLLEIVMDILADMVNVTDFPTPAASPSPAGQPTTRPTLKVVSSDGLARFEELTPQMEAQLRAAVTAAAEQQAV